MDKLDFSKPNQLQTRDGRAVRIYATDGGSDYPIHGAIFNTDDSVWELCSWTAIGTLRRTAKSLQDLVRKPRRITGWLNVYHRNVAGTLYESKEDAARDASGSCIGQIYVDAEVQE